MRRWLLAACALGVATAQAAGGSTVDALAAQLCDQSQATLAREAGTAHDRDLAVAVRPRDPRTARLASVVQGIVVGRLAAGGRFRRVEPFAGDAGAAGRAGYEVLLDAEVALDAAQGQVVVLGRVLATGGDFWARAAGRRPPRAVASAPFARAKIDAELRAYLEAPPAGEATAATAATPASAAAAAPAGRASLAAGGPRPRRLLFRPQKTPLALGAPLLALAAADLDGDGRAELLALTADELVVLSVDREATTVRQVLALEGPPPVPRPREPVGALVVADGQILARTSEHALGLVAAPDKGLLARAGTFKSYALCALHDANGKQHIAAATLGPGVSWFAGSAVAFQPALAMAPALPAKIVAATCGGGILAVADAEGKLRLWRDGDQAPWIVLDGVGTAFQVVDLDADGQLEVVASAYRPPGTGDVLGVWRLAADGSATLVRRGNPLTGGIVAVAAGDFDGDGLPDIVAAVRLVGSTRSDLWLLD
jgi:VCBS repeat protein